MMRTAIALAAYFMLAVSGLDPTAEVAAQEQIKMVDGFEPGRAILNEEPWFDAFRPTEYRRLAEALDAGNVLRDTPLLVLERDDKHLSLITMQMWYHHVAQGDLDGEPWMVTF